MVCGLSPTSVEGGKFLGFMLTDHGREANPEKCRAITEMRNPENVKEIQNLIDQLIAISKFVSELAEKTKPIV